MGFVRSYLAESILVHDQRAAGSYLFDEFTEDWFLEREPKQNLISEKQETVFDYKGFWKQIDLLRELDEMKNCSRKRVCGVCGQI